MCVYHSQALCTNQALVVRAVVCRNHDIVQSFDTRVKNTYHQIMQNKYFNNNLCLNSSDYIDTSNTIVQEYLGTFVIRPHRRRLAASSWPDTPASCERGTSHSRAGRRNTQSADPRYHYSVTVRKTLLFTTRLISFAMYMYRNMCGISHISCVKRY